TEARVSTIKYPPIGVTEVNHARLVYACCYWVINSRRYPRKRAEGVWCRYDDDKSSQQQQTPKVQQRSRSHPGADKRVWRCATAREREPRRRRRRRTRTLLRCLSSI
ncbi:unnamed protein product, partial [Ectocarpus sp. 6 AP-2014]